MTRGLCAFVAALISAAPVAASPVGNAGVEVGGIVYYAHGGPLQRMPTTPVAGLVLVFSNSTGAVRVRTAGDGTYSARLPRAGRYTVTADDPGRQQLGRGIGPSLISVVAGVNPRSFGYDIGIRVRA